MPQSEEKITVMVKFLINLLSVINGEIVVRDGHTS